MQEIKCPKCGTIFQVDESGYAQIAQQVRDKEFEKELDRREKEIEKASKSEREIAQIKQEQKHEEELSKKDKTIAEKDLEIEKLKAQIKNADSDKELAVTKAIQEKDKEITATKSEIIELRTNLNLQKKEGELREKNLNERHKDELKARDEEIERLKDFRLRQSTKMVGESLEQFCKNEFDKIRMTAFPKAYFEKDNDARSGSKGDFIYKEYVDGVEDPFISIMFEMKNEMDETATKHKNEDFFEKLHKDRQEKGCEYAVLVSLLEKDSDLYNSGIVDVSYKFEKMYVIRPQFFLIIISLLRNAALHSLDYRRELQIVKNQQIDVKNFEKEMLLFKEGFARNYEIASKKFKTAIEEIDKTIDHLQKIKEALLSSENQLRLANNKAEELSIKKLTKNSPLVRQKFDEIKNQGEIIEESSNQ